MARTLSKAGQGSNVTDTLVAPDRGEDPPEPGPRRRSTIAIAARGLGWTLIVAGALILLYLAYLLWFTNLQTGAAQRDLLDTWQLEFGDPNEALPGEVGTESKVVDPAGPGDAYAVMWFTDGQTGERKVTGDALYLVEGVEVADLRRGPGHYPDSGAPGSDGNFAISGHRTTYGAPFYNLDQLVEGDIINVIDRNNSRWHYRVRDGGDPDDGVAHRIVEPTDVWVVDDDPLGWGTPMMTLTTCHPRFSARQRMIVFAELDLDYVPPVVEEEIETTEAIEAPSIAADAGEDTRPWDIPDVFLLALAITAFAVARGSKERSGRARAVRGLLYTVSLVAVVGVLFASVFPRVESVIEDPVLGDSSVEAAATQ